MQAALVSEARASAIIDMVWPRSPQDPCIANTKCWQARPIESATYPNR